LAAATTTAPVIVFIITALLHPSPVLLCSALLLFWECGERLLQRVALLLQGSHALLHDCGLKCAVACLGGSTCLIIRRHLRQQAAAVSASALCTHTRTHTRRHAGGSCFDAAAAAAAAPVAPFMMQHACECMRPA
jgi:hypothetical protein